MVPGKEDGRWEGGLDEWRPRRLIEDSASGSRLDRTPRISGTSYLCLFMKGAFYETPKANEDVSGSDGGPEIRPAARRGFNNPGAINYEM